MTRITDVHVDGHPAVMQLDAATRHATVSWGGRLRPDGPMCTTMYAAGVGPGTGGFVTRFGRLIPLAPPPPPPGLTLRVSRRLLGRRRLLLVAALTVGAAILLRGQADVGPRPSPWPWRGGRPHPTWPGWPGRAR